jgi:hypothetical protein
MPAIFNLSLGEIYPLPNTCRGTIKKPEAASAVLRMNFLRELFFVWAGIAKIYVKIGRSWEVYDL